MKRVALYIRVSTAIQTEEGYSVEMQLEKLKSYCKIMDYTVYDCYIDAGYSGANLERPALQKMIKNMKDFDTVLVFKLDRLSRSVRDTLYLIKEIFHNNNVAFVSLSENIDTGSAMGSLFLTVLSAIAEFERETIKERMAMGKLGRVKSGKTTAWVVAPFGYCYKDGTLIIDALQAAIVRRIFDQYLLGLSISKLKKQLNDEGHIGKKKKWTHCGVLRVLSNAVYTGLSNFKGKQYKANHTPIISHEKWEIAQSELAKRQKEAYKKSNISRPFQSKYMLSGLLRCGYCGAKMGLIMGKIRKDGSRNKSFKCYSKQPPSRKIGMITVDTCKAMTYDMFELENYILAEIEQLRLNPDMHVSQNSENEELGAEISSLNYQISDFDKQILKLIELYIHSSIPMRVLDKKREELENERSSYVALLEKLERKVKIDDNAENAKKILLSVTEDIRTLSYEEQKRIVRAIIEKITLKGDDKMIEWSFD